MFKDTSAEGLSSQGEANLSPLILLFTEAVVGSVGLFGKILEDFSDEVFNKQSPEAVNM